MNASVREPPSYLRCGLEPVHQRHRAVHEDQLIVLATERAVAGALQLLSLTILNFGEAFEAVEGLVRFETERCFQDRLKGDDVKDVIVYDEDIVQI